MIKEDQDKKKINWHAIDIKYFKPYEESRKHTKVKDRVTMILDMPIKEAFKLKRQIEVHNIVESKH